MTRLKPDTTPTMTAAAALCAAIKAEHRVIRVTAPARCAARARTEAAVTDVEDALADTRAAAYAVVEPLRRLVRAVCSETLLVPVPRQSRSGAAAVRTVTVEARRAASHALAGGVTPLAKPMPASAGTPDRYRKARSAVRLGDGYVPREDVRSEALLIIAWYGTKWNASLETGISANTLRTAIKEEEGWCTRDVADRIHAAYEAVRVASVVKTQTSA